MSTINSSGADAVSGEQIAELSAAAVQASRNDPNANPRQLIKEIGVKSCLTNHAEGLPAS